MPKGKGIDLGLTGYDELFMDDASRAEAKLPRIHDIPLGQIDDFPDHPFQVRLDEDMDQLVESICANGIITPVTLRQKEDGRYEMIAGHRRRKACEIAGFATIKAEIRDLTRDEATILMVESNLQRSAIFHQRRRSPIPPSRMVNAGTSTSRMTPWASASPVSGMPITSPLSAS